MAQTTSRRAKEADELIDEKMAEAEADIERAAAPVVSDSRRRKMLKRGEALPVESAAATATSTTRKERPTSSVRDERDEESGNFITRFVRRMVRYLRETRDELARVAWPSREETLRLTYIVLAVTTASAIFLGLVSYLFSILTTTIANPNSAAIGAVIGIGLILVTAGVWLFHERFFGRYSE